MSQVNPKSKSNRSSFISVVISISLVLFLFGLVGMFVINAGKLSTYVKERISLSVFIKPDVREAEIVRYKKLLDAKPYVKRTHYITKEEAADFLIKDLGEDFVDFLGYNPLHSSVDVYLNARYVHPDSVQMIEAELLESPIVKEVFYQKDLLAMVNENIQRISVILLLFVVLLLTICFVLINNNVRLAIYSKRMLIRTMQLVGATPSFISRPFVRNGLLQGFLGGLLAVVFLSTLLYYTKQEYADIFVDKDIDIFAFFFLFVILLGMFFSMVTTYLAVRNYIKINPDKLY